jgi:glycosyltransferase involved in cell wall biosynthesis
MMKLVIQIPCYNEEATLPKSIAVLPREVDGFDEVEFLVIDDGSMDRTAQVALECGVHHIIRFSGNRGLARGFMAGLDGCLRVGADVIVNTDADNQYDGSFIPQLVKPIVDGEADMVVGDRQVNTIDSFTPTKKKLQRFGSWVVRQASASEIPDATSGFRAFSRDAALTLFVTSEFSYTLETIIQGGAARLKMTSVPVRTNAPVRKSRLFGSMWEYIKRSAGTIIRIDTMYNPLRTFLMGALVLFAGGLVAGIRFLVFFFSEEKTGHTQSLILAAILIIAAFQLAMSGILADLIGANRKILEAALKRVRALEVATISKDKSAKK